MSISITKKRLIKKKRFSLIVYNLRLNKQNLKKKCAILICSLRYLFLTIVFFYHLHHHHLLVFSIFACLSSKLVSFLSKSFYSYSKISTDVYLIIKRKTCFFNASYPKCVVIGFRIAFLFMGR